MAKGVEDFLFAFGFLSLCGWDADAAIFRGWKWGWREDNVFLPVAVRCRELDGTVKCEWNGMTDMDPFSPGR